VVVSGKPVIKPLLNQFVLATQFINLGPATLGRVGPVAIIAFTAFLVGTLLAERFNVLSLLPTTMIALPCAAGLAGGARPVSILLAMFLVWVALQLGYFAGICAQGSWTSLRDELVP
jgi:hypothetical protein